MKIQYFVVPNHAYSRGIKKAPTVSAHLRFKDKTRWWHGSPTYKCRWPLCYPVLAGTAGVQANVVSQGPIHSHSTAPEVL